jgi:lipopolysaccharide transport system ATP-binding protein
MPNTIINVKNLGKRYFIGHLKEERYTAMRDIIASNVKGLGRNVKRLFNNNTSSITGNEVEEFWALKNLNFEINQGDTVGVIGRNGAGKSTLLKVLSRITEPTTGRIEISGRMSSLLEVGTGFHPELSGRENIFLNGAILGMSRVEIKKKFDNIVDFSGVEKFLDTPVKRYSSGMYVRLAFAVAAHLESEILIVDEVLAVGDAEFRKKCLGKMSEVSKTGRTVIFVSHDMSSVSSLCNKGILMSGGNIVSQGPAEDIISQYINDAGTEMTNRFWEENDRLGDDTVSLISIRLIDEFSKTAQVILLGKKFGIEIKYEIKKDKSRVNPGVTVYSALGQIICFSLPNSEQIPSTKGTYTSVCWFPEELLNTETYYIRVNAHSFYPTTMHFDLQEAISFEVLEQDVELRKTDYRDNLYGVIRPNFSWQIY